MYEEVSSSLFEIIETGCLWENDITIEGPGFCQNIFEEARVGTVIALLRLCCSAPF